MKLLTLTAGIAMIAGTAAAQCGSSKAAQGCGATMAEDTAMTVAFTEPEMNIVETAVDAGSFTTLVAAVQAAGLADTLANGGPFTVFAPTDEAFASLPAGTVENLLKPENRELLRSVLLYHVVSGDVRAADVVELDAAGTLNGQRVDITATASGVRVDNANVVATDILTTNGTIHVIDRVIMPSQSDLIQTAVEAGSFGTLAAAIKAAGLVEALKGDGPFTVFAPTDEAFAKLPSGTVENLLKPENIEQLQAILKFHVVPGRVYSDQAVAAGSAATLQGDKLNIAVKDGVATVNGAEIVTVDIDATNGVIHVIDAVLLPN
ncbi:MAG: fasciclin domain-containing protein [Phycisphaerales bacterium]